MQLPLGIALLVGGIAGLLAARPKDGRPRFFVGTVLEDVVAISLVVAIGIGTVLTVGELAELVQ